MIMHRSYLRIALLISGKMWPKNAFYILIFWPFQELFPRCELLRVWRANSTAIILFPQPGNLSSLQIFLRTLFPNTAAKKALRALTHSNSKAKFVGFLLVNTHSQEKREDLRCRNFLMELPDNIKASLEARNTLACSGGLFIYNLFDDSLNING